ECELALAGNPERSQVGKCDLATGGPVGTGHESHRSAVGSVIDRHVQVQRGLAGEGKVTQRDGRAQSLIILFTAGTRIGDHANKSRHQSAAYHRWTESCLETRTRPGESDRAARRNRGFLVLSLR